MTHMTQCTRCKRCISLETTGDGEDLFIYSGYNHKDLMSKMQVPVEPILVQHLGLTGEEETRVALEMKMNRAMRDDKLGFVLCKDCETKLREFLQAEDPEQNEEEETEAMTEKEHYIMITKSDDANYRHIDVMLEMTPEDLINKINENSMDADMAWFWVKDIHGNKIYLKYSELWAIVKPKNDGEVGE